MTDTIIPGHDALVLFAGTPATRCSASRSHSPLPCRFVWHHLLPKECGGQTVTANLVQVCDSCHYTIHRILYLMRLEFEGAPLTAAQQAFLKHPPRKAQYRAAALGFGYARGQNTTHLIPDEGGTP